MRRSRKPIIITSRRSRLARIQAEHVAHALQRLHPRVPTSFHWLDADADQRPDQPLHQAGGKAAFVSTLQQALLDHQADLAVHSLKDLPTEPTPGLKIAAVLQRHDPRDCLITPDGLTSLAELPSRARLGTASPRRAAQVRRLRPDVQPILLRGNVDTRLRKILEPAPHEPQLHATLLACAGLHRLEHHHHTQNPLPLDEILPAAGQGALAVQCRVDDHLTLTRCLPLNNPTAATTTHVERQIVAELNADCHSPIAVHCQPVPTPPDAPRRADSHWYQLRALVLSSDGQQQAYTDHTASPRDLRRAVNQAIEDLKAQHAPRLIAQAQPIPMPHHA